MSQVLFPGAVALGVGASQEVGRVYQGDLTYSLLLPN